MSSRPRLACATTRAGLWLRTVQSEMSVRVRSTIAAQRKSDGQAAPVRAVPESFFCRTGSTLSTGGEDQLVRVLHSKFAAGISNGDQEIQQRGGDGNALRFAWGPSEG